MLQELEHEVWLRTDEIEEFIDALEHSAKLAEQLPVDLKNWKWIIISLHSALQGACVCALRGRDTAGVTMLTKKSWKEVWHHLDVESRKNPNAKMPAERLARLLDLFKRVRDPALLPPPHTLTADNGAIKDIEKLNALRNDFIHFVPKGLSLELSGMPRIVRNVTEAIEHLAVSHPTFWHHLDEVLQNRISNALNRLSTGVTAWAESRS